VCCMCVEVVRGSTFGAGSQGHVTRRPGSLRRGKRNPVSKYVKQNVGWHLIRAGNSAALLSEVERNFVVARNVAWRTLTAAVDSGSFVALIGCMQYRHAPVCRVSSGSLGTAPNSWGVARRKGLAN
jgi:hypothetical protein